MKRIYSKITEKDKENIMIDTPEKWAWTREKFIKYARENEFKEKYQPNAKELRECEVCDRVFVRQGWADHKYFETHRRKGSRRLMRMNDGLYKCPIPSCIWRGTKDHWTADNHIKKNHSDEDF
jgi:hypothetical protein